MPRFSLETALKVRERLEKLYQKALAEQLQLEQQHIARKKMMQETLDVHNNDLDNATFSIKAFEIPIAFIG